MEAGSYISCTNNKMKKINKMKTEIEKLGEIFDDDKIVKKSGTDKNEEAVDLLDRAQEDLYEVINTLEYVAELTNDDHARAYLIDHLKIFAGEGHGFMSNDFNIDKWKEQLNNPEEDEYPDEEKEYDEQEKIRRMEEGE